MRFAPVGAAGTSRRGTDGGGAGRARGELGRLVSARRWRHNGFLRRSTVKPCRRGATCLQKRGLCKSWSEPVPRSFRPSRPAAHRSAVPIPGHPRQMSHLIMAARVWIRDIPHQGERAAKGRQRDRGRSFGAIREAPSWSPAKTGWTHLPRASPEIPPSSVRGRKADNGW